MDAIAVQSYDFVNSRYIVSPDDIVVIFSHRGTKTFSIRALEVVKEHFGATTVHVTGMESPISNNTDIRIETCPQENCGAFTISLTSAIVRILQWIDMYSEGLIERFKIWLESLKNTIIAKKSVSLKQYLPLFIVTEWLVLSIFHW